MKKGIIVITAFFLTIGLTVPVTSYAESPLSVQTELMDEHEKKFTEIEDTAIPSDVAVAIAEDYPGYAIKKVYEGDDGTYKVKLELDDKLLKVFYKEDGELIKEKEVDEMKHKDEKDKGNDEW